MEPQITDEQQPVDVPVEHPHGVGYDEAPDATEDDADFDAPEQREE